MEFVPGLKIDWVLGPEIWPGSLLKIASGHAKEQQKYVQMIPNGFFLNVFQPRIDFSYGLDVEIRPKLTPSAGTQVQYSAARP